LIAKTDYDIAMMRKAGEITKNVLNFAKNLIKPGISTMFLDKQIKMFIIDSGAKPSFLNYNGFPGSACISLNESVVHGIPSDKIILKEGDIVGFDVGANFKGYHGDAARTFPVGNISEEKQKLIDVTEQCFFKGIEALKIGERLGCVSEAIQKHAERNGSSVVRELIGHGIGKKLHEAPDIPNYGKATDGIIIPENIFLAIEPMINMGQKEIYMERDGWTIKTKDGLPSAHYENTVFVTKLGVEILTL
jgi:methionyl aminopeptidase